MIYVIIFLAKLIEVTVGTIRHVVTVKGMTVLAVVLSAVEVSIWLIVTASVLTGIQEDPMKGIAYAAAFSAGILLGITVESKLALGLSRIEVIAPKETARVITKILREKGYGVTTSECVGRDGIKLLLMILVQRKDIGTTQNLLNGYDDIFVTIHDVRGVTRGSIDRRILK